MFKMSKLLKKSVFSLILSSYVFFAILVQPALAFRPIDSIRGTGPWYDQSAGQFFQKVHDEKNPVEIFGERYTAAQVDWIIWSVITWIPLKFFGADSMNFLFTGDAGEAKDFIINSVGDLVISNENQIPYASKTKDQNLVQAIFEDRPLSGVTYLKSKAQKLNLVPEANAQVGFGFDSLSSIQKLWQTSRDFSFALFVVIIITFAFMIMFRVKISPQVVISVQSALPKVIIGLILVTFSYAIAGFLVDLMYVAIGLVSLLGSSFIDVGSAVKIFNFLTKGQPSGVNVQFGLFLLTATYLSLFMITMVASIVSFFGLVGSGLLFASISLLLLIILLILIVVILWTIIKTLFMLIKAYANVLLLTIFAPFQITIGILVPSFGFKKWLKSYISNLAVFVLTGALFMLAFTFVVSALTMAVGDVVGVDEGFLEAGFTGLFGSGLGGVIKGVAQGGDSQAFPPLLGGKALEPFLFLGVSLVLFSIIPKSAELIKSVAEGRPFAFGSAIGPAGKVGGVGLGIGARTGEDMLIGEGGSVEETSMLGKLIKGTSGYIQKNIG